MVSRRMLLDHLKLARRHVAEGTRRVTWQRELVAGLARDGHDTEESKELLAQFEELLAMHVQDCNRLEQELATQSSTSLEKEPTRRF